MPKNVTVHCSDGIVAPFSESVKVPEEVVSISFMTFYCDKKVKEVTLPSTLEEICDGAFMDSSVVAIVIPESVQRIAEKAFESSSLKRLFLPNALCSRKRTRCGKNGKSARSGFREHEFLLQGGMHSHSWETKIPLLTLRLNECSATVH